MHGVYMNNIYRSRFTYIGLHTHAHPSIVGELVMWQQHQKWIILIWSQNIEQFVKETQ